MTSRVRPNFFIVGAPKCGTTSLYHYLRQHPDVFMPDWKATHFLSTDRSRPVELSEDEYFALFEQGRSKKRVGEASTEYLYSEAACERIQRWFPDAKIVISLRNPVDKIYSGHAQRLWRGYEGIEDFEEALAADELREDERKLRTSRGIDMLSYRESARYAKYVRRYIETFGRDRVHVIIFEDFVRDKEAGFADLCRFLGLRADVPIRFDRHNASKTARVRALSLLLLPASTARRVGRRLPGPMHRLLRASGVALRKWNTRYERRPPMRPEFRRSLEEEFAGDVAELSELLGEDLSRRWFTSIERRDAEKAEPRVSPGLK